MRSSTDIDTIGLDIGYSAVKAAILGEGRMVGTMSFPAGVGRVGQIAGKLDARKGAAKRAVMADDEQWIAGVEPSDIEEGVRHLNTFYHRSTAYLALAREAMRRSAPEDDKRPHRKLTIGKLVTGLPVKIWDDPDEKEALIARLSGEHPIDERLTIDVQSVAVVPQPWGGYADAAHWLDKGDTMDQARVVVADPGFFSFDWVVFDRGQLRRRCSGTSVMAFSRLLESAGRVAEERHGKNPSRDRLERVVRNGEGNILIRMERVGVEGLIAAAAPEVCGAAVAEMLNRIRTEEVEPDIVVLVGGAAETYRPAVEAAFRGIRCEIAPEPSLANARGFAVWGAECNDE